MTTDQERNTRIAKALGLRLSDEPMEWVDMVCVVQQRFTRCWVDSTGKIQACGEELPDFSTPEWQIKIQERVEELWCTGYGDVRWLSREYTQERWRRVLLMELPHSWDESSRCVESFSSETWQKSNEDALLWLAEREVKHD